MTTRGPSVLVCRGCCCGTDKHPDVDHAGHAARLRAAVDGVGRVFSSDCLGVCERSNVVVVRSGRQRLWFGEMLQDEQIEALAGWVEQKAPTDAIPEIVARQQFRPDRPLSKRRARRHPLTGDPLAEMIGHLANDPGCGWSIGIDGAVGELISDGGRRVAAQAGRRTTMTMPSGGLGLDVTDETVAFTLIDDQDPDAQGVLVLAVPERAAPRRPATGLRILGPDAEAIDPAERDATLVDLGLGRSIDFCMRTRDPELLDVLRTIEGETWRGIYEQAGSLLVASSPSRVIRSAVGRVEVHSPIPPPDGSSPEVSHTHLLPAQLELAQELPEQQALPAGWTVAATAWLGDVRPESRTLAGC